MGDRRALIEPDRLFPVMLDPAMIGARIVAHAFGRADDEADPPTATTHAARESLRPLGPCHASHAIVGNELRLAWTRRRWASVAWQGTGEPEAEAATFEVLIRRGSALLGRLTQTPDLGVPLVDLDALGIGTTEIEIIEQGPMPSRPALLSIDS